MSRQIPIGAAHIAFSRHTGLSKVPVGQPRVALGGHRQLTGWTNTQRSTGPGGGAKIMLTLRSTTPKEKEKARWQMVKPMLGLTREVLFKANCQGVPIITQPCKERKIQEHNTDMMETRAARVEQNTGHKAEPSTLYPIYRCIN